MIVAALVTFGVAGVSAFVPALPIEPYLVGAAATTGHSAVLLGVAAGIGQTAGKVLMLLAVRGSVRSAALRRWLERRAGRLVGRSGPAGPPGAASPADRAVPTDPSDPVDPADLGGATRRVRPRTGAALLRRWSRALLRALDRPAVAVPILLLSAAVGIPPLLLVVFYVAGTRMPVVTFAAACFVGRSARFVTIALVPELAGLA